MNAELEQEQVLRVFEALSSGVRLDVFRLLVQAGPQGRVAGEIASALDIPPTNLSFHLKALVQAGLLSAEQEGRYQRYRANLPLMFDTIAYLTANCCGGDPAACADALGRMPGRANLLPGAACAPDGDCCS